MTSSNQLFHSAYSLHREGKLAQAEAHYRQLLSSQPQYVDALHLLGVLCHQTGRHQEASDLIAAAININPRNSDYLNNYGLALRAAGRLAEAVNSYQRALRLSPKDLDLHNNLGNAYLELERFEEAAGCYRRVLHVHPRNNDVRNALCHALSSLGNKCQQASRYLQAEACYQEAVQYNPRDAAMHYNLGNAQRALGKPDKAATSYQQSLKLTPDDADTHNNLGNVLRELGRLDEAIASYEIALRLNPELYHAKVHLLHQKQHICDWKGLENGIDEIRDWVTAKPQAQISPFAFLAMPSTTAQEQLKCAKNWVQNRYGQAMELGKTLAFEHQRNSSDKLRIGYLSGDFRLHPLAFLITDLIESHDRIRFEVFAYSYAADDKTTERKRLEKAFDHFVDIRAMSQLDAAKKIHADKIDILVDLTGFTQTSRTDILALRPAPVQVNWLGFPGTMAAPFFDYLISDSFITAPQQAQHYSEQLALLPDCYQPNDRQRPIGKTPSREECGLPENAFVFSCLNQSFKIAPEIFAIWMRLLKAVPDSVLWLLECNRWAKANLCREAEVQGVAASRLVFAPRLPIAEHLARQQLADLFLDTLPYNAHTTASDALWMGLPVLTCAGDTFSSRVAASLLQAAGLPELATNSLEEYEALAKQLATQPAKLSALKDKLVNLRDTTALFDTPRFVANLEQAYRRMSARRQQDLPAKSFTIS